MPPSATPGGVPAGDRPFIQIVDSALADATQRAGEWLPCRLGCTQCCVGVFAINQLDAARLRLGMAELEKHDPPRAARVRSRVAQSVARLQSNFPGDLTSGILGETDEAQSFFESYGDDEVCPVLDPDSGACDLYAHRPVTCRVFGPPVRSDDGIGICELCFVGATDEEITACEMHPDPDHLEEELLSEFENDLGQHGKTIIAMCLRER